MRIDPVHVEELAYRLWRMDVATTGLAGEDFPAWPDLEEGTRLHYRESAAARLLAG